MMLFTNKTAIKASVNDIRADRKHYRAVDLGVHFFKKMNRGAEFNVVYQVVKIIGCIFY